MCREAANAIRFAELFSFMPEVVVPNMYSQFTTPRVLVMQWIQGERLRSASSQAPAAAAAAAAGSVAGSSSSRVQAQSAAQVAEDLRLVEIGVRCSLEQMLEEGFYHAGAAQQHKQ
jgi:predicted unusual protein kinase regulating ubiquinone biosynthesis (AarF/ABC1/UbiB family)